MRRIRIPLELTVLMTSLYTDGNVGVHGVDGFPQQSIVSSMESDDLALSILDGIVFQLTAECWTMAYGNII